MLILAARMIGDDNGYKKEARLAKNEVAKRGKLPACKANRCGS